MSDDRQCKLDEMFEEYKAKKIELEELEQLMNDLSDSLDAQEETDSEIMHDVELICEVYLSFKEVMSEEKAYGMTCKLLGHYDII